MNNLHPARRRLLIGGLLLAATFFYAFAGTCGLLGQALAFASSRLIGQTGSTLMTFVLLCSALAFLIPHGGVSAFIRWATHGREGRVATVVHELDTYESERRHGPFLRGRVASAVQLRDGPQTVSGEIVTKVAPRDRMKLDTVRDALKGLGYIRSEYGPLVAAMDPGLDFEVLVKGALKELRAGAN